MSGHGPNPIIFNKSEIKIGRSEHSLTPYTLSSIISHFCITHPPPQPITPNPLKVDVICVSPLITVWSMSYPFSLYPEKQKKEQTKWFDIFISFEI